MVPGVRKRRPCIRGMRIRVTDTLDLLASGSRRDEILGDFPYLEAEGTVAARRSARLVAVLLPLAVQLDDVRPCADWPSSQRQKSSNHSATVDLP